MSERSRKEALLDYLTQAVFIVFSVLLALFLDAVRVNMAEREKLDQSVGNIIQEVKSNREIIAELVAYHRQVSENLRSIVNNNKALDTLRDEFGLRVSLIAPRGIMQRFVSQAAWETSKLNNTIAILEFEKLQLLSKTYTQQGLIFNVVQRTLDVLYENSTNVKQTLVTLSLLFNELQLMEGLLLNHYDEVLKELSQTS